MLYSLHLVIMSVLAALSRRDPNDLKKREREKNIIDVEFSVICIVYIIQRLFSDALTKDFPGK